MALGTQLLGIPGEKKGGLLGPMHGCGWLESWNERRKDGLAHSGHCCCVRLGNRHPDYRVPFTGTQEGICERGLRVLGA